MRQSISRFIGRLVVELIRLPAMFYWRVINGWKLETSVPGEAKFILTAAPHTSNWDYMHTLGAMLQARRRPYITAKNSLFKPPFGWFLRLSGLIPVDRRKSTHFTEQIAQRIRAADHMIMVFTPEGTRSYTDYWRTGFYYTALQANVPIAMAYIDYERKRIGVSELFYPTGDIEADFEHIRAFYSQHGSALYPDKASNIQLRPREEHDVPSEPQTETVEAVA